MITCDMKWEIHFKQAAKKAFQVFFMLKTNSPFLSTQTKVKKYKSMIQLTLICFAGA